MCARPVVSSLYALMFVTSEAFAAAPTQLLEVKLQDPSTDPAITQMRIVLDQGTIKPGRVALHAVNESKNLVHEVVVARDDDGSELPMDSKRARVIESRVRKFGEIADLAPGKSGKLTLNLKAGTYVLFCNQPGHYHDGMSARLTVAP